MADTKNWVDQQGGLPPLIKRIADHIHKDNPGWDRSRAIAAAVNAVKKMAATGDTNLPGVQRVSPKARAAAAAAVAQWERMKASAAARRAKDLAVVRRERVVALAEGRAVVRRHGAGWTVIDLATWQEARHPRANDGKFSSRPGGGGGGKIDYTRRGRKKKIDDNRASPRKSAQPGPSSRSSGSGGSPAWQAQVSGGRDARPAPGPDRGGDREPPAPASAPTGRDRGDANPPAAAPEPASRPAEDADYRRPANGESAHPPAEFTDTQNAALMDYTRSAYEDINASLRAGGNGDNSANEDGEDHSQTVREMDAAFAAVPPLTEPIQVSRSIDGPGPFPEAPPPMTPGATFRDDGYVSTTKLDDGEGEGTQIEIRVPAGNRVIDINHTSGSRNPYEQEVLLPRGTQFRVVADEPGEPRRVTVEVV